VERLEDVPVESAPKEDNPMADKLKFICPRCQAPLSDIVCAHCGHNGSFLNEPKTDRPTFTVALESGTWLVDVHPAHAQRVWRFTGEGFDGHGSRIKRAEVARTVNELIAKAEELEGIEPSYHRPKEDWRK
jgi:hypothetical protein